MQTNGLPCEACGAAIHHVPDCVYNGGTYDCRYVQMIQLKWSDEDVWKNYERLGDNNPVKRLDELRASWAEERAKNNLRHDADFRIIPVKKVNDTQSD